MRISLEEAINRLNRGEVIAIPTDTVYGLAAKSTDHAAIDRLYSLKQREKNKPMVIQLAQYEDLQEFGYVEDLSDIDLIESFWPGMLTIVLPVDLTCVHTIIRAGLDTTAFRIPNHFIREKLLVDCGPLVVSSANLSKKMPALCVEEIELSFGKDFPIVDGGRLFGQASTVIQKENGLWIILREGRITSTDLARVLTYRPKVKYLE